MYKTKHKRPLAPDFDLIIIGTGAGGGVAAHAAIKAGKSVAVVEAEKIGGECPNFGCVPTKSLVSAADAYRSALESKQFGIETNNVHINYPAMKAWKDLAVHRTGTSEGAASYAADGITLIKGYAHFLNPWQVSVAGKRYTARHFLIATGTYSSIPPVPGLKEANYLTYREAIDQTSPIGSLFIIGGGVIGCEFADLFNTFGTKVQVADFAPRLIMVEDEDASDLLQALFEQRGIKTHLDTKITRVEKDGKHKVVYFTKNGEEHRVVVDEILVATGKAPNTDLGLENAGVAYDKHGITVNTYMQTSNKHIYAAGDVVGPYRFTHTASYQSKIAAHNMFHREKKVTAKYHAVPSCIFVQPEIASVGVTEQELKEKGVHYQVGLVPTSIIGRANTSNEDVGFVKVLADDDGVLLGGTVICPRAGEVIHELALAVQHHLKGRHIAETIHAFPTWSEALRLACQKIKG